MKIDLAWGGGAFDVVLDLSTGELLPYSGLESAAKIHEKFGGRQYYQSRSGLSGAGWISGSLLVAKVNTYRVDVMGQYHFSARPEGNQLSVARLSIWVPIDYRKGGIPSGYPVVVTKSGESGAGVHTFLPAYRLSEYLLGQLAEELLERVFEIRYFRSYSDWKLIFERNIATLPEDPYGHLVGRILEGMYLPELRFEFPEGFQNASFWSKLGLCPIGDVVYKVTKGIGRAVYTPAELRAVKWLQKAAPRNVLVLEPRMYLQQEDGHYILRALLEVEGETLDVEETLWESDVIVRLMRKESKELDATKARLLAQAIDALKRRREYESGGNTSESVEDGSDDTTFLGEATLAKMRSGTLDFGLDE